MYATLVKIIYNNYYYYRDGEPAIRLRFRYPYNIFSVFLLFFTSRTYTDIFSNGTRLRRRRYTII